LDKKFIKDRLNELRENMKWAENNHREHSLMCFAKDYQKLLRAIREIENSSK
jgi:uncharacterized protein with NAD-binding domain and iron-sulfur cluster